MTRNRGNDLDWIMDGKATSNALLMPVILSSKWMILSMAILIVPKKDAEFLRS